MLDRTGDTIPMVFYFTGTGNSLYVIMTYGCSNGAAMQIIRKIAAECHLPLAYTRTVKMVDNYLPGFDMEAEKAPHLQLLPAHGSISP